MGISTATSCLTAAEEAFLQAWLWEEGHLQQGPATRAASEHGLSLLRCLEVANRLSPNLQGQALARVQSGASPAAEWPWPNMTGPDVLRLLWCVKPQSKCPSPTPSKCPLCSRQGGSRSTPRRQHARNALSPRELDLLQGLAPVPEGQPTPGAA